MKQLFIGSVALLALAAAGPAKAADMRVKAPVYKAPPAMVAAHNWTGFYLGAHGGYGAADFDGLFDSDEIPAEPGFTTFGSQLDVKGGFGGVHAGYLWQSGPWVFGGEVAASFMNWKHQVFDAIPDGVTDNIEAKIKHIVTGVAKFGYAFDSALIYAAVGAAWAHGTWKVCDCDLSGLPTGSVNLNKLGFAVGGGATYAFAGPWSVGVEGLYMIFNGRKDTNLLVEDSDSGDFAELKNIWVVKGSLNYKFDWGKGPIAGKGPVVTRY